MLSYTLKSPFLTRKRTFLGSIVLKARKDVLKTHKNVDNMAEEKIQILLANDPPMWTPASSSKVLNPLRLPVNLHCPRMLSLVYF